MAERLQKILARAGFGSRRGCETLISQGRVAVDGTVVTELGTKADADTQTIAVDGEPIRLERYVCYLLHKPRGCVCTADDELGRPRAIDCIPESRRLHTVGRLDVESEGALLITNDGELTNLLTHPRYEVPRTYRVHVAGPVRPEALAKLRQGVHLAEGRTRPALARIKRRGKENTTLDVTITQGMNRQVRRMLAEVGLKVRQLVRIQIGPVALKNLPVGAYRRLARAEVAALKEAASRPTGRRASRGSPPPRPPSTRRRRVIE